MVQERLSTIGLALGDTIRTLRGGDRKSKPELPLNPEERLRIEKENEQILERNDFGREDFRNFCKSMISLSRKEGDSKGFARLRDRKAELDIDFNENSISVRGHPVATADPHVLELGLDQHISYQSQKRDYGFFGD